MALIGNVIWFIFAGWGLGLSWLVAAALACIFVVTMPLAPACLRLALFSAAPFGREVIDKRFLDNVDSGVTTQTARAGLNVIWLILIGFWLALLHVFWGLALCVTLIGIPFGIQAFKIAGAAWWPVGKEIVSKEAARYAKASYAQREVEAHRAGAARPLQQA
jgi:uncharacterized membrane protein YccF (DUF307 family)